MSKVTLLLLLITLALARLDKPPEKQPETSMKMSNDDAGSGSDDEGQSKTEDVDLKAIMMTCNESFRIEKTYLEALINSGSFPDETDRNPKCFVRCVLITSGIASNDGVIDPDRAAQVLYGKRSPSMDEIKEMAKTCSDRKESCQCERAYQFMKCLMEMEFKRIEKMANQKSGKP